MPRRTIPERRSRRAPDGSEVPLDSYLGLSVHVVPAHELIPLAELTDADVQGSNFPGSGDALPNLLRQRVERCAAILRTVAQELGAPFGEAPRRWSEQEFEARVELDQRMNTPHSPEWCAREVQRAAARALNDLERVESATARGDVADAVGAAKALAEHAIYQESVWQLGGWKSDVEADAIKQLAQDATRRRNSPGATEASVQAWKDRKEAILREAGWYRDQGSSRQEAAESIERMFRWDAYAGKKPKVKEIFATIGEVYGARPRGKRRRPASEKPPASR